MLIGSWCREKPLALYLFGKDMETISLLNNNTSSGGVVINDSLLHATGTLFLILSSKTNQIQTQFLFDFKSIQLNFSSF